MKKIFSFLVFFIGFNASYCQFSCFQNDVNFNINLFENKKYNIELSFSDKDGDVTEILLSLGTYIYVKDTLILKDIYHNYNCKFIRKNNRLKAIACFPWMVNLEFNKRSSEYNKDNMEFVDSPFKYFVKRPSIKLKEHYKLFYSEYRNSGFSVAFMKPNHYTCRFGKLVLSEGKFILNKNEFRFFDNNLHFTFCGIINDNSINVYFLPIENTLLRLSPSSSDWIFSGH